MAEQINSKFPSTNGERQKRNNNESVDLDNLFAFLSEATPNGQNTNSKAIINELDDKMNNLIENLDEELENVIQQELDGLTEDKRKQHSTNNPQIIEENIINNNTVKPVETSHAPQKTPTMNHVMEDQQKIIETNTMNNHYQQNQQNNQQPKIG
jgi:hypothetical protein